MSTETIERVDRKVSAVFVVYRDVARSLAGVQREVSRTAFRGDTASFPKSEAERLDALGALEDSEKSAEQAVLDRALNPTDNKREGMTGETGEAVTVSPPSLGAEPSGSLTKGDTGTGDVQPAPGATPDEGGGGSTFDARGASLDDTQAWLRSERPTAPEVVAAANDDAEAAETLLEAEQLVSNGDPRKTVEAGLQAIIDGSDGGGS